MAGNSLLNKFNLQPNLSQFELGFFLWHIENGLHDHPPQTQIQPKLMIIIIIMFRSMVGGI